MSLLEHVAALHVAALHVAALHVAALYVAALHVAALHVAALHVAARTCRCSLRRCTKRAGNASRLLRYRCATAPLPLRNRAPPSSGARFPFPFWYQLLFFRAAPFFPCSSTQLHAIWRILARYIECNAPSFSASLVSVS